MIPIEMVQDGRDITERSVVIMGNGTFPIGNGVIITERSGVIILFIYLYIYFNLEG